MIGRVIIRFVRRRGSLVGLLPLIAALLLLLLTAIPRHDHPPDEGFPSDELLLATAAVHARIASINTEIQQRGQRWRAGVTSISHLSPREFEQLLGAEPPREEQRRFAQMATSESVDDGTDLPASWDWRTLGAISPVRNQGACGSCWAFAAAGACEALLQVYDDRAVDLSEQHAIDCNADGYGCDGGWMTAAYRLWRDEGALSEEQIPYAATDAAPCQAGGLLPVATVARWEALSAHRTALKRALLTAPLAVAMHVYPDFQHYKGGVYEHAGSDPVNHAVLLVGWDDAREAWIIRNSWGSGWGEGGFAQVRYDCCRLGTYGHRVVIPAADPLRVTHTQLSSYVLAGETQPVRAIVTSVSGALSGASATLHVDSGAGFLPLPMASAAGDAFAMTFECELPAQGPGTRVRYYIEAQDATGRSAEPPTASIRVPAAIYYLRRAYADDFEAEQGWVVTETGSIVTEGSWEWGEPEPTLSPLGLPVQPGGDHSPSGTRCFATGLAAGSESGDNDLDGGWTTLTSPQLALEDLEDVVLRFWYWFATADSTTSDGDLFVVEASRDDGDSWVVLHSVQAGPALWQLAELPLATLGNLSDAMRIRYTVIDSLPDSVVEAAVDDVEILTSTNAPPVDEEDDGDEPPLRRAPQMQAGPNPTRGPVQVTLHLPQATRVEAAILDASGRRVRRLWEGELPGGTHVLDWDGRDERGRRIGAGRYWARLVTPEAELRRAITVLR